MTGFVTEFAGNGRETVGKAFSCDYDLMLMDVQRSEMGGLEATRVKPAMDGLTSK